MKKTYAEKSDIGFITHKGIIKDIKADKAGTAKNRQGILYRTIKVLVYACLSCAVSIDLVGISRERRGSCHLLCETNNAIILTLHCRIILRKSKK